MFNISGYMRNANGKLSKTLFKQEIEWLIFFFYDDNNLMGETDSLMSSNIRVRLRKFF